MGVYREFRNSFAANEARQKLDANKISSRLVVDPLSSYFPALCRIETVALEVSSDQADAAKELLDYDPTQLPKAS